MSFPFRAEGGQALWYIAALFVVMGDRAGQGYWGSRLTDDETERAGWSEGSGSGQDRNRFSIPEKSDREKEPYSRFTSLSRPVGKKELIRISVRQVGSRTLSSMSLWVVSQDQWPSGQGFGKRIRPLRIKTWLTSGRTNPKPSGPDWLFHWLG